MMVSEPLSARRLDGCSAPRIALFLPAFTGGGIERVTVELANSLNTLGAMVDIVMLRGTGPGRDLVFRGVRILELGTANQRQSVPALAAYIRRWQPTAVLSTHYASAIITCLARIVARRPVRLVVAVHNAPSETLSGRRRRRELLLAAIFRKVSPGLHGVVAVSQGVADDVTMRLGVPRQMVRVIPNPVITEGFMARSLQPVDHPWFSNGSPPVVLGVGHLEPRKDFTTLLQAFAMVREHRVARLVILGDGPERMVLASLACDLGVHEHVALPGFIPNPLPYMRRASVFALSSRAEGLPTVLIEALACGTPVVSTDCPYGPREILAGGRYGYLVPVGDADAMAQALDRIIGGGGIIPSEESWAPYQSAKCARRYLDLFTGAPGRAMS